MPGLGRTGQGEARIGQGEAKTGQGVARTGQGEARTAHFQVRAELLLYCAPPTPSLHQDFLPPCTCRMEGLGTRLDMIGVDASPYHWPAWER